MKLKTMLLILIALVIVPEILLVAYVTSKYAVNFSVPQEYSDAASAFLAFLLVNPMFLILLVVVFIVMAVLYAALKAK
jgi:hypothetical protein